MKNQINDCEKAENVSEPFLFKISKVTLFQECVRHSMRQFPIGYEQGAKTKGAKHIELFCFSNNNNNNNKQTDDGYILVYSNCFEWKRYLRHCDVISYEMCERFTEPFRLWLVAHMFFVSCWTSCYRKKTEQMPIEDIERENMYVLMNTHHTYTRTSDIYSYFLRFAKHFLRFSPLRTACERVDSRGN